MTRSLESLLTLPRRMSIGFDDMFDSMEQISRNYKNDSYPPHNLVTLEDDRYLIEIAVVGFKEKDIEIGVHEGALTITGEREARRDQSLYVHKGISSRRFEKKFQLNEYVTVKGASLRDGLLSILLEREVPEEKRPQKISISNEELTNDNQQLLAETGS